MQALRNCTGRGSPAKNLINGELYKRCPRAISLESVAARYLVNLYFDCRDSKTFPAPGGPMAQTAFAMDLFNYLDGIVADTRRRRDAEAQTKANKK